MEIVAYSVSLPSTILLLESSGYYVIDKDMTRAFHTKEPYSEYRDFEALFDHIHALNKICLLDASYRST